MQDETQPQSQIDLDSIGAPSEPSKISEPYDKKEQADLERQEREQRKARKEAELKGFLQDIAERKKYAFYCFVLACLWLALVTTILLAQGFSWHAFKLSDSVLLALLGTTTVNVLGLFFVVTKYLFPSPISTEEPKDKLI